ncbi:hypothetical protein [Prauserella endophytica]|uniref:Uncharacterized protein n=1 Tax=Prauserella endophytica TaxID=1592324 RepID=A0ABY2RZ96_9PSEU|nr:hypothetical protein [Prauserella endophytica]TKG66255.1 hypothetical protein FCN18_25825 [Prauserella endophytica]
MPRAVAARPRDQRGYPVPAITPWQDEVPQFAELSAQRMFLCAVQGRCTVCGLPLGDEPVWRVVDHENAELVAAALTAGTSLINEAPAFEGPAHRACALYSAAVCPYLAGPTARRSQAVSIPNLVIIDKGEARGPAGAVVAFDGCRAELAHGKLAFFYGQPVDMIEYQRGDDLLDSLAAAVRGEPDDLPRAPAWLRDDEGAAQQAFEAEVQKITRQAKPR